MRSVFVSAVCVLLVLFCGSQSFAVSDNEIIQEQLDNCANLPDRQVVLDARTYRITRSLRVPANCSLVGQGNKTVLLAGTAPGEFDNADGSRRMESNAVVIAVFQSPNSQLKSFKIVKENGHDGTFVKAIYVSGSPHVLIDRVVVERFNLGGGHITLGSSSYSVVQNTTVRSGYTNAANIPYGGAQMTGIEIDNDLMTGYGESVSIQIRNNNISSLLVGPATDAQQGVQTDGINVPRSSSQAHVIENNLIEDVGEGIDIFGADIIVRNNVIRRTAYFGIKLIHGAQRNTISGNRIVAPGYVGILLSGSAASEGREVRENVITGNTISQVGHGLGHPVVQRMAPGGWSGIMLADGEAPSVANYNRVANNIIIGGPKMAYALACSRGHDNRFESNSASAWTAGYISDSCTSTYVK